MNQSRLHGLIAAAVTPLRDDGTVDLDRIAPVTEQLIDSGVNGLYVCGSTGEGMSLTSGERKEVAKAYVDAADGRVPIIVQIGHNSLAEGRELAAHAAEIGADLISATCPSYLKVATVDNLIDCMATLADGAPELPFYYYHIPALTGSQIDVVKFLERGGDRITNLAGLKYTNTLLHEFQRCREVQSGRLDVVWGCDEMLLAALATGATAAIGSTYNIAAPLYQKIIDAFEHGDLQTARQYQSKSVAMVGVLAADVFHAALKEAMGMLGMPVGRCRLPIASLNNQQIETLRHDLVAIGFFDWCGHAT